MRATSNRGLHPPLDADTYASAVRVARENGFDVEQLSKTAHIVTKS